MGDKISSKTIDCRQASEIENECRWDCDEWGEVEPREIIAATLNVFGYHTLLARLRESTDELTYLTKRYGMEWNTTEAASVNNQISANEAALAKGGEE